jgi:hypothetical protein
MEDLEVIPTKRGIDTAEGTTENEKIQQMCNWERIWRNQVYGAKFI